MPVILTIAVSRLVFSMRAARARSKARQPSQDYEASQGWKRLSSAAVSRTGGEEEEIRLSGAAESHRDDGEEENRYPEMRGIPEARYSPAMDSESGDEDEDEKDELPGTSEEYLRTPLRTEERSHWPPDTPVRRLFDFEWPVRISR